MFALAQEIIIQLGLTFKNVELDGKYLSPGVKKGKGVALKQKHEEFLIVPSLEL